MDTREGSRGSGLLLGTSVNSDYRRLGIGVKTVCKVN